jgi:nucleotide-binding universal stress UspA family protein
MFKTIVVGTDGSSTADIAVARGAELARLTGAKLHIVSAYTPTAARVVGEKASGEYSIGPDFKVDAVLAGTISNLRAEGIEISSHAPKGDPADAIVQVAVREGADLIVLGSKGMQGARRVLGSIPNKVSHNAPCDLLIVATT